VHLHTQFFRG